MDSNSLTVNDYLVISSILYPNCHPHIIPSVLPLPTINLIIYLHDPLRLPFCDKSYGHFFYPFSLFLSPTSRLSNIINIHTTFLPPFLFIPVIDSLPLPHLLSISKSTILPTSPSSPPTILLPSALTPTNPCRAVNLLSVEASSTLR